MNNNSKFLQNISHNGVYYHHCCAFCKENPKHSENGHICQYLLYNYSPSCEKFDKNSNFFENYYPPLFLCKCNPFFDKNGFKEIYYVF